MTLALLFVMTIRYIQSNTYFIFTKDSKTNACHQEKTLHNIQNGPRHPSVSRNYNALQRRLSVISNVAKLNQMSPIHNLKYLFKILVVYFCTL